MAKSSLLRLQNSWSMQVRVVHALMIRELITRFGRENIGFLWIMAEPLLFAGLVGLLWHFTHGSTEHGVGVIAFVATGYIPITLFRHGVSRSVAVFTANQSLLYHRQVKTVDFILARFIIEVLGGMMAYLFMAVVLIGFGQFPIPSDIGLLIAGWLLYSVFCFSLCLIIAPLSEMSETMEKFIPVITYIMIPFSGLFYMVSWLTPDAQAVLLFSPFVNCMEMMRKGIWGDQVTAYYNIWNPIVCSTVAILMGLILCRRVRRTLTVE
ncbi:MAG: ABC transporter permease [Sphingobium sp.]|uniref:ABC transporter permease n=1 Tax=Sphingobium sp. CECT 9361 TaxID=2845384 RepID=UPI001E5975FD|nr:ABC transporter permease [Sphingobium sp. CECT 9361]CAH0356942.1 Polysialic acid transport protein KpsM [Sphingobium sp. CECT 9361]